MKNGGNSQRGNRLRLSEREWTKFNLSVICPARKVLEDRANFFLMINGKQRGIPTDSHLARKVRGTTITTNDKKIASPLEDRVAISFRAFCSPSAPILPP